jgi:gliding motility-associated-like protein
VDVAIDMEDQNGCVSDTVFQQFIEVVAMPIPDFTFNPSVPTIDNPRVDFTSNSQFFQDLFWTFGEGTSGMSANESVLYPDTGWYPVTLMATNRLGCDSSVTKMVRIFDNYRAFIPSAFSPNDNRLNETWVPFIRAVQSYELKIYNRWGELILETSNPLVGWNGKYHNTGNDLQEGVYVYTISVLDIHGERHKEKGTVYLMR